LKIDNQNGADKDEEDSNEEKSKEKKKSKKPNDSVMNLIWKLIKYTSGNNEKQQNVKFHFPVFVQVDTTSSEDENDVNNLITILASLPKEYQVSVEKANPEEAPKPIDTEIKIENIKSFKCYTR
jgi:hypothetical protein